ncbi:MAG: GGDEF domain-containing protein [Burkholderiales bacterium]|nr:MAG: GGDEF domain-containing protein [Burkholderiales bacterium]
MRDLSSTLDEAVPLMRRVRATLGLGIDLDGRDDDTVERLRHLEHGARVAMPVMMLAAGAVTACAWDPATAVALGAWWVSIVAILGVRFGLLRPVSAAGRSPEGARRMARGVAVGTALTGAMMGGLGALAMAVPEPEVRGFALVLIALVCGLSPFGLHPLPLAWASFNATMVGLVAFSVVLEYPDHLGMVVWTAGLALGVGGLAMRALHVDLRLRIAQGRRIDALVGTLRDRSHRDALTGLRNRQWLGDYLANLSDRSGVALAFIDLDGFKTLNDTHGHAAGDLVLRSFAEALQRTVRGLDHVVRLGGDEFVIVMGAVGSLEAAQAAAERILASTRVPVVLPGGTTVVPEASHGVSMLAGGSRGTERALHEADAAMYDAKRRRRADG